MKKYGYLYEKIYDIENIRLAHNNAKRGKSHYSEVRVVEENPEKYFTIIHNILKNKTFKNSEYIIFMKNDNGKEREIYKLPYFPDRIIHHCIMNILEPIWMKTLIRDTYSSLKGRGIHDGVRRIEKYLVENKPQYCLKMDVKKFYPSINHSILKKIVRKKIKDPNLLWLLDEIIDSAEGVPIGNYLSQYFGNIYLSQFDHWIKEKQKCKYYFRYCDDLVVLDNNKELLHKLRYKINNYLNSELGLKLKNNWQVFPINKRGIDFLGYRFYNNKKYLRKSIKNSFVKKTTKVKKNYKSMTNTQIINGIMSYYGWFKYCKCKILWNKYIDNNIKRKFHNICFYKGINNPLRRINKL